jgi:TPR repeat protein
MDLANALTELCTANDDASPTLLRAQDAATWMVRQSCPDTRDAGIQLLVWLVGRGCAWAKYNLAVELILGASLQPDFARANDLLHQAIRGARGDAGLVGMACGALAENYDAGRGVRADRVAAQYWYERAAEFGNAPSAFNAALFYEGEPRRLCEASGADLARAAYFYELAAQRLPVAKVKLATLHLTGAFAGADTCVGIALLQEASLEGHAGAQRALRAFAAG